MTPELYWAYRQKVAEHYERDIDWSEALSIANAKRELSADLFALEIAFVICNSGMKATIAGPIYNRVRDALREGRSATSAFGHAGKAKAIDDVWRDRERLLAEFLAAEDKVAWCETLPWVGKITKYHLAKNLGVDCAKPDRWLVRVAEAAGETVDQLCARLAAATGDRVATVDYVIWRACERGWYRPFPSGSP